MKTKAERRESSKKKRIKKIKKDWYNKDKEQIKIKRNDKTDLPDF